jgi:hypothetical protein
VREKGRILQICLSFLDRKVMRGNEFGHFERGDDRLHGEHGAHEVAGELQRFGDRQHYLGRDCDAGVVGNSTFEQEIFEELHVVIQHAISRQVKVIKNGIAKRDIRKKKEEKEREKKKKKKGIRNIVALTSNLRFCSAL